MPNNRYRVGKLACQSYLKRTFDHDIVLQKMQSNRSDCEDLANHIAKLMSPILTTLQDRSNEDIDCRLKDNLEGLEKCVLPDSRLRTNC